MVTRRMSIRYAPDWTPLGLDIDALSRGSALAVHTTVTGTSAASEVTQLGQTIEKSDAVSARTLLLPNMFFASFEALALQLSAMTEDTATLRGLRRPTGRNPSLGAVGSAPKSSKRSSARSTSVASR